MPVETGANREDGFTLAELLVVLVLMGIVLGVAFMSMQALQASASTAEREADMARQVTFPLLQLEKTLVQNIDISIGEPYRLVTKTDRNLDGIYERHTITATSGGALHLRTELLNNAGAVTSVANDTDLSTDNTNVADGIPLFHYYDQAGAEITDAADVPSRADSLVLVLRATVADRSITESKTISFRNRD